MTEVAILAALPWTDGGNCLPTAGASVSKHLVCLLIALSFAGGCRPPTGGGPKSPITALPAGSFARQWAAKLDLKNDPVRELHLEGDRVFVYTRGNQSYVISRAGGALQFINDVDVSGGVLRAP